MLGALLRFEVVREDETRYILSVFAKSGNLHTEATIPSNNEIAKLQAKLSSLKKSLNQVDEIEYEYRVMKDMPDGILVQQPALPTIKAVLEEIQKI